MRERVGELFILGFDGFQLPEWLLRFEAEFGLGGVILFDYDCARRAYDRNVSNPVQLRELCRQVHALKSRPLICIDQEGGKVRRLKEERGFKPLAGAGQFPSLPLSERRHMVRESFTEMVELGIHFDLAPVVDLNLNPDNPDIAQKGRTFSADAGVVRENALLMAEAAREVRLGLCLKHFPGVGAGRKNSHEELLDLSEVLTEPQVEIFFDVLPHIPQSAVLVSHGIVNQWDPGKPASVSKVAIEKIRQRCPEALVVSDDLDMQGLLRTMTTQEASIAGIEAGLDLLIVGNNMADNSRTIFDIARAMQTHAETNSEFRNRCRAASARTASRKTFFYGKC